MAKKECEKIIDLAIEQGNTSGPVEQHARKCPECAAALACLLWLKTGNSPTAGLTPSAAYISGIERKISTCTVAATSAWSATSKLVVGILVTTALAAVLFSGFWHSDSAGDADGAVVTAPVAGRAIVDKNDLSSAEDKGEAKIVAPVMQFQSPADDVD